MSQERPAPEDIPGSDGIELLRRENGTGAEADEEQLGITEEEVDELEDDAEGGQVTGGIWELSRNRIPPLLYMCAPDTPPA